MVNICDKFYKHIFIFFAFLFAIVAFFSCGKKRPPELAKEEILAKVGDRVITAREFKYSFEFSLSPFRRGANPRRVYLDYLIKELLLANEGYRLGLDKTPYVKTRVQRRRYNDLLEAFIKKHVHDKVHIPEDKLQDAIKKSTVQWRMILWPTDTLEEAEKARVEASQSTLEDYVKKKLSQQETELQEKRFFETDWIDYLDIPPEVLEKVVDLEMGKTSEPFPYENGYAIAQVLDIQQNGILEDDLHHGALRKKIEARLHNIEADRIVHALMDSILTPMDVRVKGRVVEELAQPLYDWFQAGLPERKSVFSELSDVPDSAQSYIKKIASILNQTLVTYQGGSSSVSDYLEYMDYYRRTLKESQSFDDFSTRLVTEIGRMIKNNVFIEIAEKEGFADSASIVRDVQIWEQKWTYDMYRHRVVRDLDVTDDEMQKFFKTRWRELDIADVDTTRFYKYKNAVHNALLHEKQTVRLSKELERLRDEYPIWIDEELLNKIDLIDSLKASQTTYFLRKNFSWEPVIPTADMKWLHF